jgi:hypothetical protein
MKRGVAIVALSTITLTGCSTGGGVAQPAAKTRPSGSAPEVSSSSEAASERNRSRAGHPDATPLAAFEVKESAFSDFGMSLKTNFEVKWGGDIQWMEVTAIDAHSSAARMKLGVGDRILAIDGRLITELHRDAMLERFFQRKKGESSRMLVHSPRDALPRFVTLIANRPGG